MDRFGAKLLIRLPKAPLDTLGAAVSARVRGMVVFAGPIWVREDKKTGTLPSGADAVSKNARYKMQWRIGLGFDLVTAKKWLSSK